MERSDPDDVSGADAAWFDPANSADGRESVHIPTPLWGALTLAEVDMITEQLAESRAAADRATAESEAGAGDPDTAEPVEPEAAPEPEEVEKPGTLGATAMIAAIATVGVTIASIGLATDQQFMESTVLAWVAIGFSAVALLAGVFAAVTDQGRVVGAIAAVLGVLGNPWILLQVLNFLAPT